MVGLILQSFCLYTAYSLRVRLTLLLVLHQHFSDSRVSADGKRRIESASECVVVRGRGARGCTNAVLRKSHRKTLQIREKKVFGEKHAALVCARPPREFVSAVWCPTHVQYRGRVGGQQMHMPHSVGFPFRSLCRNEFPSPFIFF